jgi:hypothetical protein
MRLSWASNQLTIHGHTRHGPPLQNTARSGHCIEITHLRLYVFFSVFCLRCVDEAG